ncbi:hypothetical protein QMK34_04075 [Amycolatopsis sp. H20-H5]|nr:hypothetical protein [Amycolatopsis sp. H20-H5]
MNIEAIDGHTLGELMDGRLLVYVELVEAIAGRDSEHWSRSLRTRQRYPSRALTEDVLAQPSKPDGRLSRTKLSTWKKHRRRVWLTSNKSAL